MAGPSVQAAEATLRWKFSAGDCWRLDLRQTTVTETTGGNQPQRLTLDLAVQLRWQIDRVDAAGVAASMLAFQRLAARTIADDEPPVVFDSASQTPPAEQYKSLAAAVQPLLRSRCRMTVSARGEITDVAPVAETESLLASVPEWSAWSKLLSTTGIGHTLRPALGLLPAGAVPPGDTWSQSREVESPAGQLRLSSTFTYDGPVARAAPAADRIRVVSEVDLPAGVKSSPGAFGEPSPPTSPPGTRGGPGENAGRGEAGAG